jgi:hypothetical protein
MVECCERTLQIETPGAWEGSSSISMISTPNEQLMRGCCDTWRRMEERGTPHPSAGSAKLSLQGSCGTQSSGRPCFSPACCFSLDTIEDRRGLEVPPDRGHHRWLCFFPFAAEETLPTRSLLFIGRVPYPSRPVDETPLVGSGLLPLWLIGHDNVPPDVAQLVEDAPLKGYIPVDGAPGLLQSCRAISNQ